MTATMRQLATATDPLIALAATIPTGAVGGVLVTGVRDMSLVDSCVVVACGVWNGNRSRGDGFV